MEKVFIYNKKKFKFVSFSFSYEEWCDKFLKKFDSFIESELKPLQDELNEIYKIAFKKIEVSKDNNEIELQKKFINYLPAEYFGKLANYNIKVKEGNKKYRKSFIIIKENYTELLSNALKDFNINNFKESKESLKFLMEVFDYFFDMTA